MRGSARLVSPWLALVGLLAVAACGGPGAAPPTPARPIDERRAIEVIRRAVREDGAAPTAPREVPLPKGPSLRIDVGVRGHAFGIAFVTREEAERLGGSIPARNLRDERLPLAKVGDGGAVRVLLLYQDNYVYDDLAGDAHEHTAIAAEQALARDVQDFISYARSRKLE